MGLQDWGIRPVTPISDEQFALWQGLIESKTGMIFTQTRRPFLEISLSARMREIGAEDYDTYYELIASGARGEREWLTLVDRLAVQETSFFRHASSYELVESYIKNVLALHQKKSLNLWSAGCSTGEEPYSLALLVEALLASSGRRDIFYGITATDISLPTLAKAKLGIYSERKLFGVPETLRQTYFRPLDNQRDWQIDQSLRARVAFAQLNLMELDKAPFHEMDIIFCQNVLIYFRRFRKRDVVTHLAERLQVGGMLILGVGEVLDWHHPTLERVDYPNTLAYRRVV
ncbi:MAG TPA: CheR family methyltransferase [Agitococcus sp.]|uniref:CheR family methyltransferase n=1 Tax=uncultured Agitococcus sp. TaxID=1506599 RepID=UPI00261C7A66|nr:CheR family methyltransferase [uncultured Agitococcus sp.]HMU86062.1 CheR family methyltransferase [Agitococcus sp.]HMV59638.1 CheR family methyltransferase [Agitococcus sp.]HMX98472.1 CheR family methyltransferase [Agitococcus sp.]HMY27494.1 CheR family methyltransferase [Agitococcus sp.]HMY81328.1 CheR family methyltransferase [Agitococcus sp.]